MVLLLAINTDLKAYETLGNQPKKKRKQQGISTEKLVSISTTTFKHKTPPSKKNKTVMKG